MRKNFLIVMIGLTAFVGAFLSGSDITEARRDYYISYDKNEKCNAFIDIDSIEVMGYDERGRTSWASVYWANGKSWHKMGVTYNPNTGAYYYSGGAGGFHKLTYKDGLHYNFCVLCDRFAYGN